MTNIIKISLMLTFFLLLHCSFMPTNAIASDFANPLLNSAGAGCRTNNMRAQYFTSDVSVDERIKICLAIGKITDKLNATAWSPALLNELTGIWNTFSVEAITVKSMPNGTSARILAMAEPFPAGSNRDRFVANVYLRPEKSDDTSFFQVLLHELRHVYDFNITWKNKTKMNSLDLERRAFLLMSKLSQEAPETESSGIPKFWKESWANLPLAESSFKRETAIENYLQSNKIYSDMASNQNKEVLDFSYLNTAFKPAERNSTDRSSSKTSERLPDRQTLPATNSLIPQNIKEADFKLEKPKNLRDEKEILRVALRNETKLYYGMSNFVYDEKLALQCWSKGKVVSEFTGNDTVARTTTGNTLQNTSLTDQISSPCLSDYQALKTDFTETFWASPALEKMPITFAGFVDVDGKTLARYTVLQPDAKLFNQLASQYSFIKPFRVFVGTIFVSPEDGQIVKFWGTSFPDNKITNNDSQNVFGSYLVTALRQKLNINNGTWVTVFIATSAANNIDNKLHPFSYTVKFENYRQSTTDVRIVDEASIAAVTK